MTLHSLLVILKHRNILNRYREVCNDENMVTVISGLFDHVGKVQVTRVYSVTRFYADLGCYFGKLSKT